MRRGILATLLLPAGAAEAEPVFVNAGAVAGQGWLVRRGADCLVVTAGHVVEHSDRGVVVGRGGLKGVFRKLDIAPPPGADLALLRVEGEALERRCPASSLGYDDSRHALSVAKNSRAELVMEVVEPTANDEVGNGQARSIPVLVDTFDSGSSSPTFVFVPARRDLPLLGQGDSGAAILDPRQTGVAAGQPVGVVVREEVGKGFGIAVRFDLAKAMVQRLAAAPPRGASRRASGATLALAEWDGSLGDPLCVPTNALDGSGCPVDLRPRPGLKTSTLTLLLSQPTALRELRIAYDSGGGGGVGIAVKATADQVDWTAVRYCRAQASIARCALGEIVASRLRLTFSGPVVVRKIEAVEVGPAG